MEEKWPCPVPPRRPATEEREAHSGKKRDVARGLFSARFAPPGAKAPRYIYQKAYFKPICTPVAVGRCVRFVLGLYTDSTCQRSVGAKLADRRGVRA